MGSQKTDIHSSAVALSNYNIMVNITRSLRSFLQFSSVSLASSSTASIFAHSFHFTLMKQFLYFLLLISFSCQNTHLPIEPGISKQLADWRVLHIHKVNYQLQFRIPEQKDEAITGTLTSSFELDTKTQDLAFDFKGSGAKVSRVVANGEEIPARLEEQHLLIDHKHLKNGMNQVDVEFTSPDQSLNRNDEFLYTLFVPDRASTAFPCFDQPNLKATFTLSLQIPQSWKAVANAPEERMETQNSASTHYFTETELLPTYLFAFAAGKFETISRQHNNKTYNLYHRENSPVKLAANTDSIFSLLFRSVDHIEAYTGIPYPFAKYDLVVIPSFQYGGMEHPGVTLYRDSRMFLEGNPTQREQLDRANLIAHETAHMWFGDLVTMTWFDQVWLKEVYANFIADKITAPLFPGFNQDLLFLMAHYTDAYSVDRTAGANPVNQQLDNLKDAGNLYGPIIYHKAPIVMAMLENRIGKQALQKGLQQYLQTYSYANAGWDELIGLLDTDKSLKKWSKTWVDETGRPNFKLQKEKAGIRILQSDPSGKSRVWEEEAELVIQQQGKLHRHRFTADKADTLLRMHTDSIDWMYLNGNGKTYGFVAIDPSTQTWFSKNLSSVPDVLLRASVWVDLNENLHQAQLAPIDFAKAALNNLPQESDPVLYETVLGYLTDCYQSQLSDDEKSALQAPIESFISEQLTARPEQANTLCHAAIRLFRSPLSLATLEKTFADKQLSGKPLTTTQLTDLALTLAMLLPEKAEKILDEQESRLDNPDLKARFRFIRPVVSSTEAVRDSAFLSFALPENREHEPWVQSALAWLNHPDSANSRVKYIEPGLKLLPEIQQTGDIFFPQRWASALLQGHKSRDAAVIICQFLNTHPDFPEPLRMKVLQSADKLLRKYPPKD